MWQCGCDRVCEQLVEVGMFDLGDLDTFVLDVADKDAGSVLPPGDVWLESHTPLAIEVERVPACTLGESCWPKPECFTQCCDDEVLEDAVHVDQEGGAAMRAKAE